MTPDHPRRTVPLGGCEGLGDAPPTAVSVIRLVPVILLSAAIGVVSIFASPPAHAQDLGDRLCEEPVAPDDLAAGDLYACALAARQGVTVVGSLLDDDWGEDSGSIYVFDAEGFGGVTGPPVKLVGSTIRAGDQLGFAVATDGARVVAGAPFHDSSAKDGDDRGAALVFSRVQGEWREEARLAAPEGAPRDQLGHAVAVAGPWVAVGAPGDDGQGAAAGAVWVFERRQGAAGATWVPSARLQAADGRVGSGFGFALALEEDTLLVGAPFRDGGAGAVYVFQAADEEGDGFFTWRQVARLAPAEVAPARLFGTSVALEREGDQWVAAVGARLDDGAADNSGAVWIFRGRGGDWAQEARLTVPASFADRAGDEFGTSVALERGLLAVGARFGDAPEVADAGVAHLFERQRGEWRAVGTVTAPAPAAGDELGFAVALDGGRLLTGAYRDDDFGPDAGTACAVQVGQPILRVTKTRDRATVVPGEPVVYSVTVANEGRGDVGQVQVVDRFPPPLTCTWSCEASAAASCTPGPLPGDLLDTAFLPVGERVVYTARCTVPPGTTGTLANTATVSTVAIPQGGPITAEDADTAVLAPRADLQLANVLERVLGGTATFRLDVVNNGPSVARTVRLDGTLGADLGFLAASPPCDEGLPCVLGDLAPGDRRVVRLAFAFQGNCDSPADLAVSHTATVTSPTADPSTADRQAEAQPDPVPFCAAVAHEIPTLGNLALLLLALSLAAVGIGWLRGS